MYKSRNGESGAKVASTCLASFHSCQSPRVYNGVLHCFFQHTHTHTHTRKPHKPHKPHTRTHTTILGNVYCILAQHIVCFVNHNDSTLLFGATCAGAIERIKIEQRRPFLVFDLCHINIAAGQPPPVPTPCQQSALPVATRGFS